MQPLGKSRSSPSWEPGGASPNGAERTAAFLRLEYPTAGVRGRVWRSSRAQLLLLSSFWGKKGGKKLRIRFVKKKKKGGFFVCGSPRREDGALAVNYKGLITPISWRGANSVEMTSGCEVWGEIFWNWGF